MNSSFWIPITSYWLSRETTNIFLNWEAPNPWIGFMLQHQERIEESVCVQNCTEDTAARERDTPDSGRRWHNSRLSNPRLVKKFPSLWKESFHLQGKMGFNNVIPSPVLSYHVSVSYEVSVLPCLSDGSRREEEFCRQTLGCKAGMMGLRLSRDSLVLSLPTIRQFF